MQPRTLAILIVLLPLLASNGAFILSASQGFVPWCLPYIEGCTTISQAGRSGYTIFFYRLLVFPYGVLLMLFWLYSINWLELLHGHTTKMMYVTLWLGMLGSIGLLIYIDFLGTHGDSNRLMRRAGAALYFILIPLAQSLLLYQYYRILCSKPATTIKPGVLQYQLIIVLLIWFVAAMHIFLGLIGIRTSEMVNIIEWNFSLLINLYSAGMIVIWKNYKSLFPLPQ